MGGGYDRIFFEVKRICLWYVFYCVVGDVLGEFFIYYGRVVIEWKWYCGMFSGKKEV